MKRSTHGVTHAQGEQHVAANRLKNVAIERNGMFTRTEAEHTTGCSSCLGVFAWFFNKGLNSKKRRARRHDQAA